MTSYQCPTCGKGTVRTEAIRNYETKVQGLPVIIPLARLGRCDNCGAIFVPRNELSRWAEILQQRLSEGHVLLGPDEVRGIRHTLNMSVGDFAKLIGTTRQSVYNWERPDRKAPQLRIADLLLRLLRASLSAPRIDVIHFLQEQAHVLDSVSAGAERTQSQEDPAALGSCEHRAWGIQPRHCFDAFFGPIEHVPELPILSRRIN